MIYPPQDAAADSVRAASDSVRAAAQEVLDSLAQSQATAYDSIWPGTEIPVQSATGLEAVMLSNDKLYVVLAVVLIIWIGISIFLLRTDRQIDALERLVEDRIDDSDTL